MKLKVVNRDNLLKFFYKKEQQNQMIAGRTEESKKEEKGQKKVVLAVTCLCVFRRNPGACCHTSVSRRNPSMLMGMTGENT